MQKVVLDEIPSSESESILYSRDITIDASTEEKLILDSGSSSEAGEVLRESSKADIEHLLIVKHLLVLVYYMTISSQTILLNNQLS